MDDINKNDIDNINTDEQGELFIKGQNEPNKEEPPIKIVNDNIDNVVPKIATPVTEPVVKKRGKPSRKKKLIEDYKKIMKELGLEIPSNRDLNRTKINVLEKKLADATNKASDKILTPQMTDTQKKEYEGISDDLAVRGLYNLNVILAHGVERLSVHFEDALPANLIGFKNNLCVENEENLKNVLKDIVREHGESIKPYLSPISIWLAMVITSATTVASANARKNSNGTRGVTGTSSAPLVPSRRPSVP